MFVVAHPELGVGGEVRRRAVSCIRVAKRGERSGLILRKGGGGRRPAMPGTEKKLDPAGGGQISSVLVPGRRRGRGGARSRFRTGAWLRGKI